MDSQNMQINIAGKKVPKYEPKLDAKNLPSQTGHPVSPDISSPTEEPKDSADIDFSKHEAIRQDKTEEDKILAEADKIKKEKPPGSSLTPQERDILWESVKIRVRRQKAQEQADPAGAKISSTAIGFALLPLLPLSPFAVLFPEDSPIGYFLGKPLEALKNIAKPSIEKQ